MGILGCRFDSMMAAIGALRERASSPLDTAAVYHLSEGRTVFGRGKFGVPVDRLYALKACLPYLLRDCLSMPLCLLQ